MEEYKFNSENNFSNPGERNTATPITVYFKEPDFSQKPQKKQKSGSGKVLATVCTLISMLCVSIFSGILTSNFIVDRRLDAFMNTYTGTLADNEAAVAPVAEGGVNIQVGEETAAPIDSVSTSQETSAPLFPQGSTYAAVANAVKQNIRD